MKMKSIITLMMIKSTIKSIMIMKVFKLILFRNRVNHYINKRYIIFPYSLLFIRAKIQN